MVYMKDDSLVGITPTYAHLTTQHNAHLTAHLMTQVRFLALPIPFPTLYPMLSCLFCILSLSVKA